MPTPAPGPSSPAIRTLLLCDLVASTQLVERLGDAAAADLLARHDRVARDLLAAFSGREIDKSDGFLLLFERPIEAVRFAMAYQASCASSAPQFDDAIASRVGIHLGEVVLRENSPEDVARGAKPLEVEGLAKAIAARVMSLAGDGRILLTRAAYDFARRAAVGHEDEAALRWAVHGRYRLAGVEDLVEVCEVAEAGADELTPPPNAEKAQRVGPRPPTSSRPPRRHAGPLLAVLAFDNLSSDPEMQFFSDGVSEEIIQRAVARREAQGDRPHVELPVSRRSQGRSGETPRIAPTCSTARSAAQRPACASARIWSRRRRGQRCGRTATTAAWKTSSPSRTRSPRTSPARSIRLRQRSRPRGRSGRL